MSTYVELKDLSRDQVVYLLELLGLRSARSEVLNHVTGKDLDSLEAPNDLDSKIGIMTTPKLFLRLIYEKLQILKELNIPSLFVESQMNETKEFRKQKTQDLDKFIQIKKEEVIAGSEEPVVFDKPTLEDEVDVLLNNLKLHRDDVHFDVLVQELANAKANIFKATKGKEYLQLNPAAKEGVSDFVTRECSLKTVIESPLSLNSSSLTPPPTGGIPNTIQASRNRPPIELHHIYEGKPPVFNLQSPVRFAKDENAKEKNNIAHPTDYFNEHHSSIDRLVNAELSPEKGLSSLSANVSAKPVSTVPASTSKAIEPKPAAAPSAVPAVSSSGASKPIILSFPEKALVSSATNKSDQPTIPKAAPSSSTASAAQPPIPSFAPTAFGANTSAGSKPVAASSAAQPPIPSLAPKTFGADNSKGSKPAASSSTNSTAQPPIPSFAPKAFGADKLTAAITTKNSVPTPPVSASAPKAFEGTSATTTPAVAQPPIVSAAPSKIGAPASTTTFPTLSFANTSLVTSSATTPAFSFGNNSASTTAATQPFGAPTGSSLFSNTAATTPAAASVPPPTGASLFGGGAFSTTFGQGFSFANPGAAAGGTNIFQQPDKPLFSATPGAFFNSTKK